MENLIVAIVSCDEAYNRALMLSLLNVCRDLTVRTYDNHRFVQDWSDYHGGGAYYEKFDIILWAGDEISDSYGDNIIYLTDRASLMNRDYFTSRFCLYKYSTANTIVAAIFDIYAHLTGRGAFFMHKEGVRLIGFASCSGGAGCTTVAMSVGQELCRFHGSRVLYLTLEDVESTGDFINTAPGKKNAGEFLYRLLGSVSERAVNSSNTIPFLDGYLLKNPFGVEAFAPARGKNPLRELSPGDMQKFIATLIDCGRFDVILLDLSTCLTDASIAAMALAEKICFTARAGELHTREKNYLSQVISCGGEGTIEKMIKIENMHDADYKINDEDISQHLAECEMITTKDFIRKFSLNHISKKDISLEGGFGADISRLTGTLMESREAGCQSSDT